MKLLSTLVVAVAALASGTAFAATYSSDAERRSQNREEALTKWRAGNGSTTASATRNGTQRADAKGDSLRDKTHRGADSVRNFTHRQAEKSRRFTERQDRRYGKKTQINTSPEGGTQ